MLQTVNEDWWHIEARSAAFSHSYYTVALNRIGVEKFYSGDKGVEKVVGPFFGSTYITAPDGSRTKVICTFYEIKKQPKIRNDSCNLFEFIVFFFTISFQSLTRNRNGILYAELDLNLCQQMKDCFGFKHSQRWPNYIENFKRAADISFQPQIIQSDNNKID